MTGEKEKRQKIERPCERDWGKINPQNKSDPISMSKANVDYIIQIQQSFWEITLARSNPYTV